MSEEELKGKKKVIIVIFIIIITMILDLYVHYIYYSNKPLVYDVIKDLIVLLVCYNIYLGKKWVAEYAGIMLFLRSVTYLIGVLNIYKDFKFGVLALMSCILYFMAGYLITIPKDVKAFLNSKLSKNQN